MSPPPRWTATRPRASWRLYKIAALAAVVLALFGITLAWVLLFPNYYLRPRFLPLVVYEYGVAIPTRPWAEQDAESLQRLRCWGNNTESLTGQTRELLLDKLRHLDSADPNEPLVVYLSAYVVPDERGEPHLLPSDGRLDQKESWLPLRDALGYLVKCPARKKLLLLDVMQPLLLPAEGLLRGDVADRAWPLLQQVVDRDENLLILTACSPGQLPRASEELGHSAFVYYLLDGLRGGGDGKLTETRVDGRVTVHELAAYVTERVDAWADHSLLVRQTPFLLGGAAGFPLSSNKRDQGKDDDPLPEEYPGWLGDGWKLRDRWWRDGVHRRAPRAFAELERGLLQQEGRWRAGVVAERVRKDFEMILAGVKRKQGESAPADPAAVASLAEARARKPDLLTAQDAESVADLRRLLARRDRLAEGKPDEAAAKQLTGEVEAFVKKYEKRHVTLALLACETLREHAVGPEGVKLLADQLRVGDAVEFTEVRFLDRLARRAKAQPGHYSAPVAQLAMRAVGEAAQAATASPEVSPWIREQLARGARLTRAGEALLFESQEPWAEPAKKVCGEAYDLYRALNGEIRTLEEAHRCRDDALALLPGYLGALEIDDHYTDAWRRAADTARDLRQALLTPLATPGVERSERLALLGRLTDSLRNDPNSLHMLRQPLSAAGFSALIEQRKTARAADCKKWQVMLATPWPSAPQRLALWSAYRACSRLLHDECAAAHTGGGRKLPTLRRWDDQAAKDGRTQLLRHDLLRARCAFSRLQLSDPHGPADLGRAIDEAQRHPDDPARWRALGDALKRAAARPDPAEVP